VTKPFYKNPAVNASQPDLHPGIPPNVTFPRHFA